MPNTVIVRRVFAAPPQRLFEAWTNPSALRAWFRPARDWIVTSVDVELRPGGGYRIAMRAPAGETVILRGTYQEIDAPKKLTFTWGREGDDRTETLVMVEFQERQGMTEVTLTHGRFPDAATRDRHERGWQESLRDLDRLIGKGEP